MIPAVVVAVSFAVNLVYPFGDHGVLIIDSLHQYLPFFTEFHEKLVNNESFLYSMGGGLGINFWATIAYYLASPMNFLLVLFPKRNMMDVMALFIVLKLGLCGCTFSWYLAYKEKGKSYFPVLFGTMYALSSFMIGYYFNLMWFDSIAMLPLVMLGIERIVKGGNGKNVLRFSFLRPLLQLLHRLHALPVRLPLPAGTVDQCKRADGEEIFHQRPDLWLVCVALRRYGGYHAGSGLLRTRHHRVRGKQISLASEALPSRRFPAYEPVRLCGAHQYRGPSV